LPRDKLFDDSLLPFRQGSRRWRIRRTPIARAIHVPVIKFVMVGILVSGSFRIRLNRSWAGERASGLRERRTIRRSSVHERVRRHAVIGPIFP
jgi:hypothetical protein